jgi:hypothetical protein
METDNVNGTYNNKRKNDGEDKLVYWRSRERKKQKTVSLTTGGRRYRG